MGSRRSRALSLVLTVVSLAFPAACPAQPKADEAQARALTEADKDAFIRMAMRSGGLPGLQTVVVKNGQIVWARSYGYAVLRQPGPLRAMANDSIVFSASVAKILVAVAVLQQVDRRRLSLDDDVNKYLPFSVRNPAWPDVPITWRMLLTHTSSLNEEDDERASSTIVYGKDADATLRDYIDRNFGPAASRDWPDRFRPGKPGTERIYSNAAFVLAAFGVQRLVDEPFYQYVQHAILDPLGMRHSSYWLRALPVSRLAVGYASIRQKDGSYRFSPAKVHWAHGTAGELALDHQMTCADYPDGCAHVTALDFAQLMLMLMNRGTVGGVRILEPASAALMSTPSGFRNLDGWNQGLGLNGPLDLRGRQLWGHDGADRGAANAFYFNPQTGVGAIAFANANDPDFALSYGVNDIAFHLMSWFE